MLQLVGGELLQLRDGVGGEEVALHPPLHVGHHRLERLLADFREMPRLVDHPPDCPPIPSAQVLQAFFERIAFQSFQTPPASRDFFSV